MLVSCLVFCWHFTPKFKTLWLWEFIFANKLCTCLMYHQLVLNLQHQHRYFFMESIIAFALKSSLTQDLKYWLRLTDPCRFHSLGVVYLVFFNSRFLYYNDISEYFFKVHSDLIKFNVFVKQFQGLHFCCTSSTQARYIGLICQMKGKMKLYITFIPTVLNNSATAGCR